MSPEHFTEYLHGFTTLAVVAGFGGALLYDLVRTLVLEVVSALRRARRG